MRGCRVGWAGIGAWKRDWVGSLEKGLGGEAWGVHRALCPLCAISRLFSHHR